MEILPNDPALRRQYYIGAAIGAVLLLVIVIMSILLLASADNGHQGCKLSETMPDVKALLKEARNIPSADSADLANMVGYLFVYGKGFLPLKLTEFIKSKCKLLFKSECATFSWNYRLLENQASIEFTGMNLQLDTQVKDGLKCDLQDNDFLLPMKNMFSCSKRMSLVCRSRDSAGYMTPVAELVLESLQFELYGEPAAMKEGHFDKPLLDYSCQVLPWH